MGRTKTTGGRKGVQVGWRVGRTKGVRLGLGELADNVQRSGAGDDGSERSERLSATMRESGVRSCR